MMLEQLKKEVYRANMMLVEKGLVINTWGNVSGIDREKGLVVIKPSGVEYSELSAIDLPVLDLEGNVIEGYYKPSSDTATHLALYRAFPEIGGITHTHSLYATSFAQAGRGIKAYGTTHADYFPGIIPCSRKMSPAEIGCDYELNTGKVIIETISDIGADKIHACLVYSHGPFTWGSNAIESVDTALVLEVVAQMAFNTEILQTAVNNNGGIPMQQDLLLRHFNRKHGPNATYGQI
jgi:L-ribulose-5-phosphate 4-epimerase